MGAPAARAQSRFRGFEIRPDRVILMGDLAGDLGPLQIRFRGGFWGE